MPTQKRTTKKKTSKRTAKKQIILGIAGPKLAGKGTAVEYLNKKHGFMNYTMSDIWVELLARMYKDNSRSNIIAIANAVRDAFGENILAHVVKQDLEEMGKKQPRIIIDGIRMHSEIDVFKDLPGFSLVYMDAPIEERYERAVNRGEKAGESEMSFDEFKAEEGARTEIQIKSLKDRADFQIFNAESTDTFYEELDQVIDELS